MWPAILSPNTPEECDPAAVKRLFAKIILACANTGFVRSAMEERADLTPFRAKPTPAILAGVFLIAFSFLLGWPAVAALGVLSLKMQTPWIVAVGGPLTYGLSHLVFLAGMYISGGTYTLIFCRWLARVAAERALAWAGLPAPVETQSPSV